MTVSDKEPIELKLGETQTITVPKFLKEYAILSSDCPGNAKVTLSADAPDFVKLSTQEEQFDDQNRPIKTIEIAPIPALTKAGKYRFMIIQSKEGRSEQKTTILITVKPEFTET